MATLKRGTKKKELKNKIYAELVRAVGRHNAISMQELYRRIFGHDAKHDVHDTAMLRQIITEMREEGVPICSSSSKLNGGYYIPVGEELEEYLRSIRKKALKTLNMEAKIRKVPLINIIEDIKIALIGGKNEAA